MEMTQIQVVRAWPGVRNGQVTSEHPLRARRLIALGLAKLYVKRGRKPKSASTEE